ncbi:MAG: MFS transporter [Alphaproteobacteria bacterium]|nr:MFS transporter [Alphaproteobacteria bacterium]
MPVSPFSLLREPGFLRVWAIGLIGNTMRWLELLAIGIFVFEVTGSALLVAVMTIARQLPLALFGTFIGPIAERTNRKYLLIAGFSLMTLSTGCMGVLASLGVIEIWHIAICVFINGSCWALDYPVRRTLIGEFAGAERLGTGISLDSATNNITRMIGPLAGGVAYGLVGLKGAFIVSGVAHFFCVLIAVTLVLDHSKTKAAFVPYLEMLKQGLNIVRGSRELIGIYLITIILNVFGFPYASMVPVLGRARYQVEPALIGLLSAAEGAGAFAGALFIAFVARPAWFKRLYLYGAVLFVFLVFCLSFATQYWMAMSILLLAGLGMAGFGAMQSTLVLLLAPPEARSRLMGLLSVCIGCAPIGLFNLGLLADWFGAPTALTVVSSVGLILLAATVFFVPQVRR